MTEYQQYAKIQTSIFRCMKRGKIVKQLVIHFKYEEKGVSV